MFSRWVLAGVDIDDESDSREMISPQTSKNWSMAARTSAVAGHAGPDVF